MLTRTLFSKKRTWILAVIVILVGLTAAVWIKSSLFGKNYSVVYLTSGEIYVGHFYTFPHPRLEGAYILQNVKSASDQTKNDIQLFPLAEAVWAPTKLYIRWDHVIYYGPLDENSVAAKSIRSKLQIQ